MGGFCLTLLTAQDDDGFRIHIETAAVWLSLLLQGSRSSLDTASCRSVDSARPVGQVDRHIQLMVHGVAPAGKCYSIWQQMDCGDAKQRNGALLPALFA